MPKFSCKYDAGDTLEASVCSGSAETVAVVIDSTENASRLAILLAPDDAIAFAESIIAIAKQIKG